MKGNIVHPESGKTYFRLKGKERCVFLDDNNLCEIISNCGEGYLCDVCRLHPRFFNWLPERTEAGLGLCCEEACRLLFSSSEKLIFTCEEDEDTDDDGFDEFSDDEKIIAREVLAVRDEAISILQNREYSFIQRTIYAVRMIKSEQDRLFGLKCEDAEMTDLSIVLLMEETEPVDELWKPTVAEIKENLAKIKAVEREFNTRFSDRAFELENICVYYFYRYISKSIFDGELYRRNVFCYRLVRFIKLLNINKYLKSGEFTVADSINNTKYVSKQIEYSEENIEALTFG